MDDVGSGRVFVGVSLRNKKLTAKAVSHLGGVARDRFSARRLVFLLADELELINLRAFGSESEAAHERSIEEQCQELESSISEGSALPGFPSQMHVETVRWRSILNNHYWRCYFDLFSTFIVNSAFRDAIQAATSQFVDRRRIPLDDSRSMYLCQYVLAEMPVLLRGIRMGNKHFQAMIYPAAGSVGIDKIADDLSEGVYGDLPSFERQCAVATVPAP